MSGGCLGFLPSTVVGGFFQPTHLLEKDALKSNWLIFPRDRGEHKRKFETT